MSDQPQPVKPGRLSGLVAPKGAAARPSEVGPAPTADAVTPVLPPKRASPEPQASPAPVQAPRPSLDVDGSIGTGSKALTLRLSDPEYERLRRHAFVSRMKHQTILALALRRYLDEVESK